MHAARDAAIAVVACDASAKMQMAKAANIFAIEERLDALNMGLGVARADIADELLRLSFVKTSNPNVLMMYPTENRDRYDAAEPQ